MPASVLMSWPSVMSARGPSRPWWRAGITIRGSTATSAATGRDEGQARRDYREWAEDERRLWADCNGEFGIDAAEYAAAIARADIAAPGAP